MLLANSISLITRDKVELLMIDNDFATAEISLFGGHIISFIPKHDGRDRLWVSKNALFDNKKAIRGGVPICWPWFGDHASNNNVPSHGYVRKQGWQVTETSDSKTGTSISLKPQNSEGAGFGGKASLVLKVEVGTTLSIKLETSNLGDTPFDYTCALHSYFSINDINQCQLKGLSGQYKDKTRDFDTFETVNPYLFSAETDRVHLQQPSSLSILDNNELTEIQSKGHDSIVVWNPWQDKSISMSDMADDSYLTMLCVETAVTQGQVVLPNETHVLEQRII